MEPAMSNCGLSQAEPHEIYCADHARGKRDGLAMIADLRRTDSPQKLGLMVKKWMAAGTLGGFELGVLAAFAQSAMDGPAMPMAGPAPVSTLIPAAS